MRSLKCPWRRLVAAACVAVLATTGTARAQEFQGTCVQYIKAVKPGYRQVNGGNWVAARDLPRYVSPVNRGWIPTTGSVMVLDAFGTNPFGHVGEVVAVNGNRFLVRHANWDAPLGVSMGTYTLVNNGRGVTYNGGSRVYPLICFVYAPQ